MTTPKTSQDRDSEPDSSKSVSEKKERKRGAAGKVCSTALKETLAVMLRYPYLLLIAVIAVAAVLLLYGVKSSTDVKLFHNRAIADTPSQITSIRSLGEWECMHITTEEMVDTVEKHTFGDKELIRIYHGTMILGADLREIPNGGIRFSGDTAFVTVPAVKLLNPEFIDEARTRTFCQKGKFDAGVYDILYRKARTSMLRRSLTPEIMTRAKENLKLRFTTFFRSFGYNTVIFDTLSK